MARLNERLQKLESSHGSARHIVLSCGHGHSDDDISRELEAHGISRRPTDTLVLLRTIYQDEAGRALSAKYPPLLLSITK